MGIFNGHTQKSALLSMQLFWTLIQIKRFQRPLMHAHVVIYISYKLSQNTVWWFKSDDAYN